MKAFNDLDYYLMNTRHPNHSDAEKIEKCFLFWKQQKERAFKALGDSDQCMICSDDFLDREVGALFYRNEPIGLFFNNWFDVSRDSIIHHSYLKKYPTQVIEYLRSKGFKKVMVLSSLTLASPLILSPNQTQIEISELLFSLGVLRFKTNRDRALVGYLNSDKTAQRIFDNHGGVEIYNSVVNNCSVGYFYMDQDIAKLSEVEGVKETANYLWSKMEVRQKDEQRSFLKYLL